MVGDKFYGFFVAGSALWPGWYDPDMTAWMTYLKHLGWLALMLLIGGCANHSQFIAAEPVLPLDANSIVLIYNHGSGQEFSHDQCRPNGLTTPRVVKQLAQARIAERPVVVYGLCFQRWGDYRHHDREGEPKVVKRAKAIEETVRRFQQQGIAPGRIFLVGHSAGAWASLLVVRRAEVVVAGVIGFAPAFAGPAANRSEGWLALREAQVEYLMQAPQIEALIYAFEGDAFNPPEALAFLQEIDGVQLRALAADEIDGRPCGGLWGGNSHRTAFDDCFADTQYEQIVDYIESRLRRDDGGV